MRSGFRGRCKTVENINKYLWVILSILVILWGIWRLYCYYQWTAYPDLIYGYLVVSVGDLLFIMSLINREKLIVPVLYSSSILLISLGIFSSLYIPHTFSVVFPIILGVSILIMRLSWKDRLSIITLSSSTLLTIWAVYRTICYIWWKFLPDLYYGILAFVTGTTGMVLGETTVSWSKKIMLSFGSFAVAIGGFGYFYLRTIHYSSAIASLGVGLVVAFAFATSSIKIVAPSVEDRQTILCYYCGTEIPINMEVCPNCGNKIPLCAICDVVIQAGEKTSQCPHCKTLFHKEHLDTWLMVRSTCPVCGEKLR
ncbi:MAG: RING finger domain-containing protein [Candidatus Baldrarchaeia archaeon]|mgnify:CR=1 FL=1